MQLEALLLNGCFSISESSLKSLTINCSLLIELQIANCSNINNFTLLKLEGNMISLNMCNTIINDGQFIHLNLSHNLKRLLLDYTPITDLSLQYIGKKCNNLQELSLVNCIISDNGSPAFQQLISLNRLNLSRCKISDKTIRAMNNLMELENLDISFNDLITIASVKEVVESLKRNLKMLNIVACKKISLFDYNNLKNKSQLQINWQ